MEAQSEEGELRVLGVFGVIKESCVVLRSRAKLFIYLLISFTLPLCLMVLAHNLAIDPLLLQIHHNEDLVAEQNTQNTGITSTIQKHITSQRIRLGFLLAAYVVFLLIFALLSTAAIVYTVACIYTKRGLTYRKVVTVVPKVWKRLLLTFLWAFLLVFFMIGAFFAAVLFIFLVILPLSYVLATIAWWIVTLYFLVVLFYFTCIFNLASVISVLEQSYGWQALKRSTQLIRGRRMVAFVLYAIYLILSTLVVIGFDFSTNAPRPSTSLALRIVLGIIFAHVLSFVDLLGTVVFTILYFTCKAYHHESVDMLALSEHLGAYAGEYVTLRASVQMEAMQQA